MCIRDRHPLGGGPWPGRGGGQDDPVWGNVLGPPDEAIWRCALPAWLEGSGPLPHASGHGCSWRRPSSSLRAVKLAPSAAGQWCCAG
eukprot:8215992-Prorocentrum_lima.AAC.1